MMTHSMMSAKIAMLLISLGIGYLVCVKADGQKGFLKQLGYWVGSVIIVVSVIAALHGLCMGICHKMCPKGPCANPCPMMRAK